MNKNGMRWTQEEARFIANHPEMKDEDIGLFLGRPTYGVMRMRYKLKGGYELPEEECSVPTGMLLTDAEKISRIIRLATEMRIRIKY